MKQKIISIIKTVAKTIVYPPDAMINQFLLANGMMAKMFSSEKARLFSTLFQHYFLQIEKAKREKRKAEIEINFAEMGAVVEYLKTNLQASFILVTMVYLIFGFFFSTAISALMLALHIPFEIVLAINAPLSIIAILYYVGLTLYLIKTEVMTVDINQKYLKQQIFIETAYIYRKSVEIDKEVADMTIQHITNSLMLHQEDKKTDENLKNLIGVKK